MEAGGGPSPGRVEFGRGWGRALTRGSLPLLPSPNPGRNTDLLLPAHCGSLRTPPTMSAIPSSLFPTLLYTSSFFFIPHLLPGTDLSVGTQRWKLKVHWGTRSHGRICSHSPVPSSSSLLSLVHILPSSRFPMAFSTSYPLLLFLPLPLLPSVSIVLFSVHSYIHSFVHSANSDIRVLPQAARWAVESVRRGLCLRALLVH